MEKVYKVETTLSHSLAELYAARIQLVSAISPCLG